MTALNVLICRVCSFASDDNESIYNENELNGIGDMLTECIGLQLEPGDGYPERICNPCRMQLGMFFNFKAAAIRMHVKFTKTLNEANAAERKKEAAKGKRTKNSFPAKSKSVITLQPKKIRKSEKHETLIEPCKSDELDNNFDIYNENEMECNAVSEEQAILEEYTIVAVRSPGHISDQTISCDQIKRESLEMDEVYLDDEFQQQASDNEVDAEKDEIPKDEDESFKANSEDVESESSESNRSVSSINIEFVAGEGQLFSCNKCPMKFPAKHRLIAHKQRHSNKRPVPCNRCEKHFKNKYDLKIHYRCHDDLRKYVCDICGKTFRAHTHMTNHRESHAAENTLKCPHCDQLYKTTMTLRRHIESMHTNRFDFVCPFEHCKKAFGLKFRLQRHIKTHQNKLEVEFL